MLERLVAANPPARGSGGAQAALPASVRGPISNEALPSFDSFDSFD